MLFAVNQRSRCIVFCMHKSNNFSQVSPLGPIDVAVSVYVVGVAPGFHVPYEGLDPLVRDAFPDGFLPAYGSGLAFKGKDSDGAVEFWCLTDRGPNGEGPAAPSPDGAGHMASKLFPAPGFSPSIGVLRLAGGAAQLVARMPIRLTGGAPASGLPIPHGALGSSDEAPLSDRMRSGTDGTSLFDAGGIDTEAIAFDPERNALWVTDEYGPFLIRLDAASAIMQERYAPGAGLPAVLALRRANRGMEGMTLDPSSGRIHAFLQSPLSDGTTHYAVTGKDENVERYARFLRWIEFDPAAGSTTRMLAYPLDGDAYAGGRTGNVKLGDLVALGGGKFVVIEQGEGAGGAMINNLMLVQIGSATNILDEQWNPATSDLERSSMAGEAVRGADWSGVTPLTKTLLLNLNSLGWVAEKAEGLAIVDECTLAMTNDNDFGLKTRLFDARGDEREDADVTGLKVDAEGNIVQGGKPGDTVRIARGDEQERPLTLWQLRFARPLASYGE